MPDLFNGLGPVDGAATRNEQAQTFDDKAKKGGYFDCNVLIW
jgi:hypothetical protein